MVVDLRETAKWRRLTLFLAVCLLTTVAAAARALYRLAPATGVSGRCAPVALSVVAGDSETQDAAYVLDACGHVTAVAVHRMPR